MKNFRLLLTFSLLFSFTILGCSSDIDTTDTIVTDSQKGLITTSGAALRIDPIVFSARVALLNKGEAVQILERSSKKSWIGKSNAYWYRIKSKNGITGWTYGTNLKILTKGQSESIEDYISEFMEEESEKLIKALKGKWWSVNSFGDFTNHCLEISEDNTYKSYTKGKGRYIKGEYNFDYNKMEIIFLKGATFGNSLQLIKRGLTYRLQKEMEDHTVQFKRIAMETDDEKKKMKNESKTK